MMKLVSGTSNLFLANKVSTLLSMPLAEVSIRRFADHEIFVEIQETVRGQDVFVLQSTSYPANDHLMELLIVLDALRRGSARRITAVIPYFGYARQDRKTSPRSPITAKLVANVLAVAGANRVLTFDFHSAQIQGFFDSPVDNLFASPLFRRDILEHFENPMIVSPDIGGVLRARAIANRIGGDLTIIDKRRERPGVSEVVTVIGEVQGRSCLLVDDIVDSGGTLCQAATALLAKGAKSVDAYAIHGVLSAGAIERIEKSPIRSLVVTDSICPAPPVLSSSKIRVLSIAPLLAEAIRRISCEESVSSLLE